MLKKVPLTIFIILFLFSCDIAPKGWGGLEPRPISGIRGFPPTNTDYGRGFKDGCYVAWKAVSKGWLADKPRKHAFDAKLMVSNPDYANGFGDGYDQCVDVMDHDVP